MDMIRRSTKREAINKNQTEILGLYSGSNRYRQRLPQKNSSSPAAKRKDAQMELHEIKNLLHNKRNGL
jgi:hypothetical protein